MAGDYPTELPLWEQFEKAAREHRRSPTRLLTDYMRECLEMWDDQKLDQEMQRDAQAGGLHEDDAVEIVKQYRREVAGQHGAA